MIIFGHNSGVAEICDAGPMECPTCKEKTPSRALVFYKYFHLWWLCSFVYGRRYVIACDKCDTMVPTTAPELELSGYSPKTAIPFLRRNGWLVCLALAACFIGSAVVFSQWTAYRVDSVIADPKPGDLYLATLTAIDGTGFDHRTVAEIEGPGYGGMKLVAVDEDMRVFATTMMVWNKKDSLRSYLNSDDLAYDLDGLVVLTREEIARLRADKVIYGARRGEPLEFPDEEEDEADEEPADEPSGDSV